MGSVKDLGVKIDPKEDEMGVGVFEFSDRYSVFDWGEMPDKIPKKGASLCLMGAYCFEELEEKGYNTHYRGLIQDGEIVKTSDLTEPTNKMEVDLVRVLEPEYRETGYDYSKFSRLNEKQSGNFLIPLEVIYRNGLPEGSSVFRRLREGDISLDDFGLEEIPQPGEDLEKPIFDVSTKLEEKDRYITWDEAKKIAGLSSNELKKIRGILSESNKLITDLAESAGLKNEDGKIELAFDADRNPMVVDVLGTLDECRFTFEGTQVSKEMAREFYRNSEWKESVDKAKSKADEKGERDWKKYCDESPPKLNKDLKDLVSSIYMSAANEFTGLNLFDVMSLESLVDRYNKLRSEIYD
ncbi:MAG: Phosphoribosylaminoimidazolesuccinocarboxamide (SAICAR) synthase PurC [Candidatus Methanohalarchaeum thermophilum]|uniref:Phosphoribosylaminoimidazole-succinocarboxamide synthase n=1 Tax=Methanohalarchaeum thermophilum TaxID=1903181 RepID=A0A1Q6DXU6_METT1|nr:MAG: Phosphoribosylaminoimidazolesuccinocarboxamide (SAICAR) synthase PurC [Candidatus Methanohalarchaeum thermophilum]